MGSLPALFALVREKIRTRHLSLRTEHAYLQWVRRYVAFHRRRHPRELGAPEVEQFFSYLAVHRKVSAATQNQAMQALLFLYRHVLEIELPWLSNVTRATHAKRLPVVLSRAEVRALLAQLDGATWLVASLLYGSGLRLSEGLRLRVKDVVVERGELIVRSGKGGKDRVTMLPQALARRCAPTSRDCTPGSRRSVASAVRAFRSPSHWLENIRRPARSGAGNTSSRRAQCAGIPTPGCRCAIT